MSPVKSYPRILQITKADGHFTAYSIRVHHTWACVDENTQYGRASPIFVLASLRTSVASMVATEDTRVNEISKMMAIFICHAQRT